MDGAQRVLSQLQTSVASIRNFTDTLWLAIKGQRDGMREMRKKIQELEDRLNEQETEQRVLRAILDMHEDALNNIVTRERDLRGRPTKRRRICSSEEEEFGDCGDMSDERDVGTNAMDEPLGEDVKNERDVGLCAADAPLGVAQGLVDDASTEAELDME